MKNKFFGSILNSILLLILIILMIIAIRLILQNKEIYFPVVNKVNNETSTNVINQPTDKVVKPPLLKADILGNKGDLIYSSILPHAKVQGITSYMGIVKGGYFFEGNILIGVKDLNKKTLLQNHGISKTDWMTAEPVGFEGVIDFSKVPPGPAYLEIHNDNASGLPENDKSILIPIIIE